MINNQVSAPGSREFFSEDLNVEKEISQSVKSEGMVVPKKDTHQLYQLFKLFKKNNTSDENSTTWYSQLFDEIKNSYGMTYEEGNKALSKLNSFKDNDIIDLPEYYEYRNLVYKKQIQQYDDFDNLFNKKLDLLMEIDEKDSITNKEYFKYLNGIMDLQQSMPKNYKLTDEEYEDYKKILKGKLESNNNV